MPNHVHILATPREDHAASRMMQDVGRAYVGYVNRRHGRTGALYEGRFKSSLVETTRYFLACMRYIEMNPVRARMVDRPGAFSGRATARTSRANRPGCSLRIPNTSTWDQTRSNARHPTAACSAIPRAKRSYGPERERERERERGGDEGKARPSAPRTIASTWLHVPEQARCFRPARATLFCPLFREKRALTPFSLAGGGFRRGRAGRRGRGGRRRRRP